MATNDTTLSPSSPNGSPNGHIGGNLNANGNIGGKPNGLDELQQVLAREGLIKSSSSGSNTPVEVEEVQADLVCDDVEAPEGTKLFFSSVRTHRQWKELFQDYEKRFGNRINMNGTGYMPDKRVGYINFHTRQDMLQGLELSKWNPREAYQIPTKAEPAPRFAAFAVGFENWRIDAIKDVAIKLLGAVSLNLREVRDEPGVCLGWGIVGFESKEKLDEALEKKKFVLQCRNKTTVIALQPYRELADRPKDESRRNPNPRPSPRRDRKSEGMEIADPFTIRRNTIRSWMEKEILSKELGVQYLQDVDRDEAKAKEEAVKPLAQEFESRTLNSSPSPQNRRQTYPRANGQNNNRRHSADSYEKGMGRWREFNSRP